MMEMSCWEDSVLESWIKVGSSTLEILKFNLGELKRHMGPFVIW